MQLENRPRWYVPPPGIAIEVVPTWPIFEKMFSSSIKRGGADAQNNHAVGFALTRTVPTALLNLVYARRL